MAANTTNAPVKKKAEPLAPVGFRSLKSELDRMFHAVSLPEVGWRTGLSNWAEDTVGLRIDVAETEANIQITSDLPGIKEEDIDVSLVDDVLRIRAAKHSEVEQKDSDKKWHVLERTYGAFECAIRVLPDIDADLVKATFDNGVLTVSPPKPPAGPEAEHKISVTSG